MSGSFSTGDDLYKKFKEVQKVDRPRLVADALLSSRDGFRCIVQVAATRSIDEDSFVQGLLSAIQEDPKNLPALRLLSWHQIRTGALYDAKKTLRFLVECWPNIPDIRRELARVSMMAPAADGDEIFRLADVELKAPLAQSSYKCQQIFARSQVAFELKLNIDHFCAEILRTSVAPDQILPEQSSRVFLDVLTKIVAAKSIALVANGSSLSGTNSGKEIDAHDLVVRCNFPEFTKFSEDVGRKVDVVFFNESPGECTP